MLIYKDDWDNAKNMLSGWWEGEVRHPLIQVIAPRSNIISRVLYDGWEFCRYPDNPEKVVDIFESWASQTFFWWCGFS